MTHYIAGKWVEGSGPEWISYNPANGKEVWKGKSAEEKQVKAAVEAAKNAFETWSATTLEYRIGILKRFQEILKENHDQLAEAISKEVGKPLWESKTEVDTMIIKIDASLEAYEARCKERFLDLPAGQLKTRHKPHGVVAVFGPFNFPGHLPNGHIVPALLAGNTIVFKPSEFTPLVAEMAVKYWEKAGLPKGVLNMIQGGRETGTLLIKQPFISGILFTGSAATGQLLAEIAVKQPGKILALELGGNNPLILGKAKDLDAAAYLTIQSAYLTAGQRCSCARRLIVPEGKTGDEFIQKLISLIQKIQMGPYTNQPEPFMGPVVSPQAAKRMLEIQEKLKSLGGKILIEMRQQADNTGLLTPGLMDVTKIKDRPDEEFFGPFLQLIRVSNFDAAIEEANNTSFGLTSGLLSDSKEEYQKFYQNIRAGVINWNSPTTGTNSFAPFGGLGRSGNYHPSGFYAADYCAYPVSSIENESVKLPQKITPGIGLP